MYYEVLFAIEIIILRGFNREVCRAKKIVEEIGYSWTKSKVIVTSSSFSHTNPASREHDPSYTPTDRTQL
jgi:hypothetical protein